MAAGDEFEEGVTDEAYPDAVGDAEAERDEGYRQKGREGFRQVIPTDMTDACHHERPDSDEGGSDKRMTRHFPEHHRRTKGRHQRAEEQTQKHQHTRH